MCNTLPKISNFLEKARRESTNDTDKTSESSALASSLAEGSQADKRIVRQSPKAVAEELIKQVEAQRGEMADRISKPQGVVPPVSHEINDDDDDEFMHMTAHIEPSLVKKIEHGKFVELEKLLPKDKFQQYKSEK